jgi:hypothetical protein
LLASAEIVSLQAGHGKTRLAVGFSWKKENGQMLGILKIFILSTNGKDVKRAILENRSTLSEDFHLILRDIEIDGSNDRRKYKSTTSPTQYVLLDRAREGSLKKSYVRNMRKQV